MAASLCKHTYSSDKSGGIISCDQNRDIALKTINKSLQF